MSSRPVPLFRDDFSDHPVAVIAGDYTPSGEYHVVPDLADSGVWREVVLHHKYRRVATSRGNWQVVELVDGSRRLEQTIVSPSHCPMLATGDPSWVVSGLRVGVQPLTLEDGVVRLAFRYVHSNRYDAVEFSGASVRFVRHSPTGIDTVAEAPVALDPDRSTTVAWTCTDGEIILSVDGSEAIRFADPAPGAPGGVALAADHPIRFADLVVEGSRKPTIPVRRTVSPKLWRKFKPGVYGTDRNIRYADLNGDGVKELVLGRRTDRLGSDNYSSISSLAAFDLAGDKLWSTGTPSVNAYATTNDLCFQVHDIDGDGKPKVIYCRDWELLVHDPATDTITRRVTMPVNEVPESGPFYRSLGDSIRFCDLTGSGRDDSILLKDRYRQLWALDSSLKELWRFHGNLGHYPYTKDIDGDGRDEVFIGHHLLDHDGQLLWEVNYIDHSDNVAILDVGRGAAQELIYAIAGSDAGFILLDSQGKETLQYPIGHGQSMCFGNLLPHRDGLEFCINTYWGNVGIHVVTDERGAVLHEFEPAPYANLLELANWVPANSATTPGDLILISTHPRQGGLIDGRGVRQVEFPDDGHPWLCSGVIDLDGDGVDEIVTWNEEEVWVYKADVPGRDPSNYPTRNHSYNDSNYRAQISLPAQP